MATTFTISSWDQFTDIYEQRFRQKRGRFYYRGQSNDSWELRTTHERLFSCISQYIPTDPPFPSYSQGNLASSPGARIELLALRAFQARSTKFLSNLPATDDTLEWLAMMRHWGMPTRLMDVTTSPHVALYFALCDRLAISAATPQPTNATVWAIAHVPLRCLASRAVNLPDHTDLSDPGLFHEHLIHSRKRIVAPVHPRTHNERLAAQQGTFLCVGDPDASFCENLLGCMPGTEVRDQAVLYKFVIDNAAAPEILGRLSTMNIHQASLYPDLQGYAGFIENSLLLFGMRGSYYSPQADWESLERLGWLG
ncbi:MAG: FRG domain-containing protein [Bryobacteraceae bacterium]|jgi:hypothetical protein